MKQWIRGGLKVLLVMILTPAIGFGSVFGFGWAYGKVCHWCAEGMAEEVLAEHREALEQLCKAKAATGFLHRPTEIPSELTAAGVTEMSDEDGVRLFRIERGFWSGADGCLPWVPNGLLFGDDLSNVPRWRKTEPLGNGWYFFWDT